MIIKYPGTTDEVVSFIGSHLDVVPADPKNWDEDPFVLRREGDLIYGRGTTDCLGHVAMLTDFFASLAEARSVSAIKWQYMCYNMYRNVEPHVLLLCFTDPSLSSLSLEFSLPTKRMDISRVLEWTSYLVRDIWMI